MQFSQLERPAKVMMHSLGKSAEPATTTSQLTHYWKAKACSKRFFASIVESALANIAVGK